MALFLVSSVNNLRPEELNEKDHPEFGKFKGEERKFVELSGEAFIALTQG